MLPGKLCIAAQQRDVGNFALGEKRVVGVERFDQQGRRILRPIEGDSVKSLPTAGETDVLRDEVWYLLLAEHATLDLSGPLSENFPWPCAVNRFAIHSQPLADGEQALDDGLGNHSFGGGCDVEQQVSVFANDIHQLVHDAVWGFVVRVLDMAPGIPVNGVVGQPLKRSQFVEPSALNVEESRAGRQLLFLIGHADFLMPPLSLIVVVGDHIGEAALVDDVQAGVKVDEAGSISSPRS